LLGIPNNYLNGKCARGSSLVLKAQDLLGVAFGELVLEERAQTGDITFNTLRFEPAMTNHYFKRVFVRFHRETAFEIVSLHALL